MVREAADWSVAGMVSLPHKGTEGGSRIHPTSHRARTHDRRGAEALFPSVIVKLHALIGGGKSLRKRDGKGQYFVDAQSAA